MTFPDLFFSFRLLASGGCHSQSPAHTELQPRDSLLSHLPTPSFTTSINLLLCSSSRPPGLPVPTSAPFCWYFHRPYIGHLSLASLALSAKPQRTHAIPVLYLIPPTLVTPNRKRNIWISAAFGLSPNKTTVLISSLFPFYHSFHPFIHFLYLWLLCLLQNTADTFPTLFHPAFLHSQWPWTLDPKYLRFVTFFIPTPCNLAVPLMPVKSSIYVLPTLTTDHNVVCKHDSPWRYLSSLICQAGPRCSLTSTLISSVTPLAHLSFPTALVRVSHRSEMQTQATPGLLFQHRSPSLGPTQLPLTYQHPQRKTMSAVLFLGMKPYCC